MCLNLLRDYLRAGLWKNGDVREGGTAKLNGQY